MKLNRRRFLIGTGLVGGGLILGFSFAGKKPIPNTVEGSFQPNAWLQITTDNRVIFQLHKAEMGQGVITSLATIIGEELDYNPANFEIEMAGVHPDFNDPMNGIQLTGGSTSVAGSWDSLRHAGAAARAMLIETASQRWNIAIEECDTNDGYVINRQTQQSIAYADLAEAARKAANVDYELKKSADYKWIGKSIPRLDARIKSTGEAQFGIDTILPGMKIAVVVRSPYFGGSVKQWSDSSVINEDGVSAAFAIHSGIAIVAESYWQARKAANKLDVDWNKGPLAGLNSSQIRSDQQQALAEGEPYWVIKDDEIDNTLQSAHQLLQAEYASPFTHHSPMEPQNATALVTGDSCEIWAPNQAPGICRTLAAHYANIDQDRITVNSTFLGGGFGRRGYVDFVGEVAAIAAQLPNTPIKLIWSREDDMQHDYYRPATYHGLQGALDEQGKLIGWQHKIVSSSIIQGFGVDLMSSMLPSWVPTKLARSMGRFVSDKLAKYDPTTADGAHIPYQTDHVAVAQIHYDSGVPTGFWRSVGFSHNCFVVESFIDELAYAADKTDPLTFRLDYLKDNPRQAAVLKLAASKANWGQSNAGVAQGIALSEPFSSHCAMVVDVTVSGQRYQIEKIVAAVDCGIAINPEMIKSQLESAIIYGLTAATKAPVTIKDGAVAESNFHDLPVLRIDEVPPIEVYIVDSNEVPTGIGEIGVPAIAPALANALFAATGQRLREMPLTLT